MNRRIRAAARLLGNPGAEVTLYVALIAWLIMDVALRNAHFYLPRWAVLALWACSFALPWAGFWFIRRAARAGGRRARRARSIAHRRSGR